MSYVSEQGAGVASQSVGSGRSGVYERGVGDEMYERAVAGALACAGSGDWRRRSVFVGSFDGGGMCACKDKRDHVKRKLKVLTAESHQPPPSLPLMARFANTATAPIPGDRGKAKGLGI